jgi:hypothetical protein
LKTHRILKPKSIEHYLPQNERQFAKTRADRLDHARLATETDAIGLVVKSCMIDTGMQVQQ